MKSDRVGLLLLSAGFAAWFAAFSILYGIQSLGCIQGWDKLQIGFISFLRTILLLIWLAFFPLLIAIFFWSRKRMSASRSPRSRFLWTATTASTAASFVALLWIGTLLFYASLCV